MCLNQIFSFAMIIPTVSFWKTNETGFHQPPFNQPSWNSYGEGERKRGGKGGGGGELGVSLSTLFIAMSEKDYGFWYILFKSE